ncbi:MAG: trimethylamine methyltransferase family protein [Lentisphaerae bacterium]|nr:trimethylamine methyltransferase family protein [Lentisphaerota bacterium]
MKLAKFKVLSEADIRRIHEASLDILESCGVQLGSARMLAFLESQGLPVERDRRIVRFPRACVEDALVRIPQRFEVFGREGQLAFVLGEGRSKIAAGHNAVFWLDSQTGRTRPATIADVELFARICEELQAIDMIGIPVMPQDVPQPAHTLLYGVDAVIRNSSKPIFFSTDNPAINRAVIAMARAVFAGDLGSQVYAISQLSPTSPLFWEPGVLEAIMETVETGVPLAILPEPNAGVSAPFTLAGLLTVNNVECLSGLVMIQLLKPGAKVIYANSWTTTDMRNGAALVGSTETTICRIAGAQLARFYHVPSHTTAPNSDNHAHDEQNAWEKTFSLFAAVGAGNDLIVNCGMFATGLTCSHEQLVMDEEMAAMSQRIAAGIKVNAETIAGALIKATGPRGGYLDSEHTLKWLRSGEYIEPRVSVRGPAAVWQAAGAKDTPALARETVEKYAAHPGAPLDPQRSAKLSEILRDFAETPAT